VIGQKYAPSAFDWRVIAAAEPSGTVLTGDRTDLRALADRSSGATVEAI
jgi:hypothetical protein